MTNPAALAAFKSKTLALIETLHLQPDVVVGLGLSMAVAHGLTEGMNRATLHQLLDLAVDQALAAGEALAAGGVANDR